MLLILYLQLKVTFTLWSFIEDPSIKYLLALLGIVQDTVKLWRTHVFFQPRYPRFFHWFLHLSSNLKTFWRTECVIDRTCAIYSLGIVEIKLIMRICILYLYWVPKHPFQIWLNINTQFGLKKKKKQTILLCK